MSTLCPCPPCALVSTLQPLCLPCGPCVHPAAPVVSAYIVSTLWPLRPLCGPCIRLCSPCTHLGLPASAVHPFCIHPVARVYPVVPTFTLWLCPPSPMLDTSPAHDVLRCAVRRAPASGFTVAMQWSQWAFPMLWAQPGPSHLAGSLLKDSRVWQACTHFKLLGQMPTPVEPSCPSPQASSHHGSLADWDGVTLQGVTPRHTSTSMC